MTDRELIALSLENDMVFMQALACLLEEVNCPSLADTLRQRRQRVKLVLDNIADELESGDQEGKDGGELGADREHAGGDQTAGSGNRV
jgi:hypothetical protein